MSWLISEALAQEGGAAAQGNPLLSFLPLIILVVLFYFLLIQPQRKRAKQHREMISNLSKGDEIVTSGGVLGKIVEVGENFLVAEVADNVHIKIQKQMVANVMPKGTMKET